MATRFYEMALLDAMGYRPELEECVTCRTRLAAVTNYWTAAGGGVVCAACRTEETAVRPISANAVKLLRLLLHGRFGDVSRVTIERGAGRGAGARDAGVRALGAGARRAFGRVHRYATQAPSGTQPCRPLAAGAETE